MFVVLQSEDDGLYLAVPQAVQQPEVYGEGVPPLEDLRVKDNLWVYQFACVYLLSAFGCFYLFYFYLFYHFLFLCLVPEGAFDSAVLSYGLWELRWLWHRIICLPFVQFLPNKVPKLPLDGLLLLPLLKLPLPVVVSVLELGGSQVVSEPGVDGALLEVDPDFMALLYVAIGLDP